MIISCQRIASILATIKDAVGIIKISDVLEQFISTFDGKPRPFPFLKSAQS